MSIQPRTQQKQQIKILPLTVKRLFYNFFLIHDFYFQFTKIKATSGQFFDLQYDIANTFINASKNGGRFGQFGMGVLLTAYFLKGRSIPLRFVYGYLFLYWIDHFHTFGTYLGVLVKMPSVYNKTQKFYQSHPSQKNYLAQLMNYMDKDIEDTHQIIDTIFNRKIQQVQQQSFVSNQFYIKNKDKYLSADSQLIIKKPQLKLTYLDCFLTRYVYYTFTRWTHRNKLYFGLGKQ